MPVPGAQMGAEAIDIKAEINRAISHLLANLGHQWGQGFVPALLRLDQTKAAINAPLEVAGGVAPCALAYLDDAFEIQQPLDGAAEGGASGRPFAEHLIVGIGVGIDANQPNRTVLLVSAQYGQGNRIAPESQGISGKLFKTVQ